MATPPTSPPPARPLSGLKWPGQPQPPRSSSRMSSSSRPGESRASDEDAKTSVKVAVRVRPPLQPGDPGFELIPQRFQRSMVHVNTPTSLSVDSPQGRKLFVFDRVFGEDIAQDGVWEYIAESTSAFLQGYNVSVMAYGQSGAGKSFTMGTSGPEEQEQKSLMGIVPRAAQSLFSRLNGSSSVQNRQATGIRQPNRFSMGSIPTLANIKTPPSVEKSWQMKATYVEIYNEQLRDLLVPESVPANERPAVTIREDTKGRILLTGLRQVPINNIDDLLSALNFGSMIRQTDATTINAKSSRSHAVFSLNLVQRKAKEPTATKLKRMSMPVDSSFGEETITLDSKLHFVDLAGSERLKNTGAAGERAKEGISINAGLASLGKVIAQLSARQAERHISYRDSKLTRLLQDSLGGNAVTYMIACINPAEFHLSETLNTVQYAQRARNIQSKPKIQQISDDANKQAVIDRLRAEVNFLRDQLRSAEQTSRPRTAQDRGERSNEKEIELQNHLLDVQENYQALSKRHAKLIAEISKAREGTSEPLPTLTGAIGESATERLQRSESFSEAVEKVVAEYEKTIESLEGLLSNTRSELSTTESKLNERESKCAYAETVNEQLQSRLSKLMERESNTEQYLHDLEERMNGHLSDDVESSAMLGELRKELARLREKDNNSEEYISSLEERLADATQDSDVMRSELLRLEHVIERQRSVGKLDNLLHEMEQRQSKTVVPNGESHTNGHHKDARDLSSAVQKVAMETAIPESDVEDDDEAEDSNQLTITPRASKHMKNADLAAEQTKFVEEKLETVNQELFDLRMEHETTINDYAQLSRKYEEAMRQLKKVGDKKNQSPELTPAATLNSSARVDEGKPAGQPSSSRSLSSEFSSVGSRPDSWEHSNGVVQRESTAASSTHTEDPYAVSAKKEQELRELQSQYDELAENYSNVQDEVEELKTEMEKAKHLTSPTTPPGQFLRRKSSQNVISIDRAHRSLASIGNIASEAFADKPDIKDQFEAHMGSIMHELHHRSERVSQLEGEITSVKKELESKVTMISGLQRERTATKAQSPVETSMFASMRDQLLQSENQLHVIHEASSAREKELAAEIEALNKSLATSQEAAKSGADTSAANAKLEEKIAELQKEIAAWDEKHEETVNAMKASEKQFRETIAELEDTLTQVETIRQQKSSELDAKALSMSAAAEAFEKDLQTHRTTIENQEKRLMELHRSHGAKEDELSAANSFKHETLASLKAHQAQIAALEKQLTDHQSAVVSYQTDLQSMRDMHAAELDETRSATVRDLEQESAARLAELNSRHEANASSLYAQVKELEAKIHEQDRLFQAQQERFSEKEAMVNRLEKDSETHTRNASDANDDLKTMRARFSEVEDSKSAAEQSLKEAHEKLNELNVVKDSISKELEQVRDREQRAGKLVEELEGQLASTFEDSQHATSRISLMQNAKDKELAEARAAATKAHEEIVVLNSRLSQLESHRGSIQSATIDPPILSDRASSVTSSLRKSGSISALPSPPPTQPLPPIPTGGATSPRPQSPQEQMLKSRVEEQEARIRSIEKHLFAEKQLTSTLEEALTDIERDNKRVKKEIDEWKQKCWGYEEELETLRKERRSNRDSMQAIEAEKAGRLRAERAREALEARMEALNKKKKKSTLNCF